MEPFDREPNTAPNMPWNPYACRA